MRSVFEIIKARIRILDILTRKYKGYRKIAQYYLASALIVLSTLSGCLFSNNSQVETPWPTLDVRTTDLNNRLLQPDDFVNYCCADSYYVKLGNQHNGVPSQDFINNLIYGMHQFEGKGNPVRVFTYEIISKGGTSNYDPEGYLTIFIYETQDEAHNLYEENNKLPGFDLAYFHDGFPYDWASGHFLKCRVIAKIYIEGYSSDNLEFLSRDISSRMSYLC